MEPTATQRLTADIRQRAGLTQAELARRAGVPRSTINAYERGHREPGVDSLSRIAASVGLALALESQPRNLELVETGQVLADVLDLAESLPTRKRGPLRYPSLKARAA